MRRNLPIYEIEYRGGYILAHESIPKDKAERLAKEIFGDNVTFDKEPPQVKIIRDLLTAGFSVLYTESMTELEPRFYLYA